MKKTIKRFAGIFLSLIAALTVTLVPLISHAEANYDTEEAVKEDKSLPFNGDFDCFGDEDSHMVLEISQGTSSEPADEASKALPLENNDEAVTPEDKNNSQITAGTTTSGDENVNSATNTSNTENEATAENTTAKNQEITVKIHGESEQTNFFAALYNEASSYFGEILSALSFAASLVIMIACKKSIIPGFTKARSEIANSYVKMKNDNEATMATVTESYDLINKRLEKVEESVSEM